MNCFKALLLLFLMFPAACSVPAPGDLKPVIMVSILPQKYLAERIAGEQFQGKCACTPRIQR
jgi:ABC-type Zn uptake system ZnuABC Zn-binding protein ZnuA